MTAKFYYLSPSFARKYFWGQALTKLDMSVLAKKGMKDFKGIVHVRIVEGTTAGDILEVGLPLLVVSSRVLEVWKPFKSFETYPVVVEGGVSPLEYSGVAFLGRGGPFDPVKSGVVYGKTRGRDGKRTVINHQAMYFDDDYWDGSDILTIDDFPCVPIVTERVAQAMKKVRVTNCRYTPLEKACIYKKPARPF